MVELVRKYCEVCEKDELHIFKTYYDGTVVQVCTACRHCELNTKGHDYVRFEKAIEDKSIAEDVLPWSA